MRIIFLTIIFITAIINCCSGQFEYVFNDLRCEKEQEITAILYKSDPKDKKLWLQTLLEAEKAVAQEKDTDRVTGSLARMYLLYDVADDQDGKNRCREKLMHYAETKGDNDIYCVIQAIQSQSLIRHQNYTAAISNYQAAVKYLEPKSAYGPLAKIYCFLSHAYSYVNNEVLSIRSILRAVSIVENECEDPLLMGEVYVHAAIIYMDEQDYNKAAAYIAGAQSIFKLGEASDNKMFLNMRNIAQIVSGEIRLKNEQPDTAIMLFRQGIDNFMSEDIPYSARSTFKYIADGYHGLGIAYQHINKYKLAEANLYKGLEIRTQLGLQDKIAESYTAIGEYYNHRKMLDSAYNNYVKGFNIAFKLRDKKLMHSSASCLSTFYAHQKKYTEAYKYLVIANEYYDDIVDKNASKEVAREEMDYMFEQERDYAKKIKDEQSARIELDNKIIIWELVFGFILIVLLWIIIILFQKKKKKNRQLRSQRDTLEQRSKMLQMQQEEISQKNQELRATTEMLEERNKELHKLSVVASVTDNAIFITNVQGDVTWFNDSFSRYTGFKLSDIGTHPALLGANMPPESREVYGRVFRSKHSEVYTMQLVNTTEHPVWVQTTITPVFDEKSDITMIVSVCTDISEIKLANEKIDAQNKEINDSITYARRIQDAIQPMKIFSDEVLGDHFVINLPKNIVSGDFHWVGYKRGLTIFTVADCTGHGVPGAFISMLGQVMLNQTLNKIDDVTAANILDMLRLGIILQLHQRDKTGALTDSIDASMFVYDRDKCLIDFAGAFSHAYILRFGKPDDETMETCQNTGCKILTDEDHDAYLIRLKPDRMPVGIDRRDTNPFTSIKFHVNHGDIAYATSDGYPDQFGGDKQKRFYIATFEKLLFKFCRLPMAEQRKMLEQTFFKWKGDYEQTDDVHVLGMVL